MRYSWELGELTPGYEWYDTSRGDADAGMRSKAKKSFISLLSLVTVFVTVSYISGGIIFAGKSGEKEAEEPYGGAVAVMSYGAVNADFAENAAETNIEQNEKDTRINELAAAYIEEYMYENYGEDAEGE